MKLRIYVTHHRPGRILSNRVIVPIHGGKALSPLDLGIQGDDTGDHVSERNPYYCELSTQYWAWKNAPALDYVGFMHYRRHFLFGDPDRPASRDCACVAVTYWNKAYERSIGLSHPELIEAALEGYDLIVPPPLAIRSWGSETVFEDFGTIGPLNRSPQFMRANLERALQIVEEREPEYKTALHDVFFETGGSYYFFNAYVLRWELFDQYSRWLFPLLDAIHRQTDYSDLSPSERRFDGYVAERLWNVWLRHYQANVRKLAIRHIPLTMVEEGVWSHLGEGKLLTAARLFGKKLQGAYEEARTYGPSYVVRRVLRLPTEGNPSRRDLPGDSTTPREPGGMGKG